MPTSNSYFLRHYGISLDEKTAIIAEQRGKCAACGRVFDETCRTEVDHEHFKVTATRITNGGPMYQGWAPADGVKGWIAVAIFGHTILNWRWAKTKAQAVKLARKDGLRPSVRGVLCGGRYAGCNRKLGRIDKVPWLQSVVNYLQDPPARRILKEPS